MAAIDDNKGAVWESDELNHEMLHVVLDLAISAHSQPEQERERRDQGIEIGNKGIALESRGHLLLRLRRAHGPEVPGRRV